jgi:hypothetical protein
MMLERKEVKRDLPRVEKEQVHPKKKAKGKAMFDSIS